MFSNSRLAAAASALALAAFGTIVAAPPASASDLTCGQVITVDTELTHDLVCPAGADALVIGANGITLDLKGFTISGPGAYATLGSGVRAAQKSGVTITNGTITGFRSAVVLDQSTHSTVSKIVASDTDQAINLANATDSQVLKNTVTASRRDAIRLGGAHGSVVSQNVLNDNQWAISVSATNGAVVERNQLAGTHGTGIAVFDGSIGTTISQNVVTFGWVEGIRTSFGTAGSIVVQNKTSHNGWDGITVHSATVTKNTSTYNGWLGIRAMTSIDGGGNKAAYNGDPAQCLGVTCTLP